MEVSLKDLKELFNCNQSTSQQKIVIDTPAIVILDRGFIYVGMLSFNNDTQHYELKNASNIRKHTGGKGLGDYIINGWNNTMTLDKCGDLYFKTLISYHPINLSQWKL